ncbi:MAG: phosphoglucosamine mutase [Thermodesulfovibrionales bacterium]|nr:phosphoglucosamine mutase [Thermodesulfovibrionales bacterium]
MRLFGTDGIRGKANIEPLTPEMIVRIGMAIAKVLRKSSGRNMILIGKDTRLSGYMVESALTSGICSMGMNVILIGPLPTPGIAFLTRALRVDAGIAISASHNPFEDNGIKCFSSDGFKLPDKVEERIEQLVEDQVLFNGRPAADGIGKAFRLEDATGRYIEYIKSTIPRGFNIEGLRIVVDCANGAAYKVTPWVLRELGADVVSINDKPDGKNINKDCGSLYLEGLRRAVIENSAHLGIAHDGDADRTIFIDEKGNIINGDHILAICALDMKRDGRLKKNKVVATVMSNLGVENYLNKNGIEMVRTKVGDRYVVERMLDEDCNLGGEQSGHIVFLDHNTTGDGPITALQVLYLIKKTGRTLSELTKDIIFYPQILINVPVRNELRLEDIPELKKDISLAEEKLGNKGRILVRRSGTESKIRIMVEGEDELLIKEIASHLADRITRSTGERPP